MTFRLFICLQCGYKEHIGGRLGSMPGPFDCLACHAGSAFELDMDRIVWSTDPPDKPLVLPGMVPEAEWMRRQADSRPWDAIESPLLC
jgi:hypothetical protein